MNWLTKLRQKLSRSPRSGHGASVDSIRPLRADISDFWYEQVDGAGGGNDRYMGGPDDGTYEHYELVCIRRADGSNVFGIPGGYRVISRRLKP